MYKRIFVALDGSRNARLALDEALRIAEAIAQGPTIATKLTRELIYQGAEVDIETALRSEHFAYNVCRQTNDHEEAVRAFLEKRPPIFHGK